MHRSHAVQFAVWLALPTRIPELPVLHPQQTYLDSRVAIYLGDLTDHAVDAIVNAANSSLMGGGGVDGAIHRRGGPSVLEACREVRHNQWPNGLPTGQVVITTGGALPARFVIHTVGPIHGHHAGNEASLLAACYRNAVALAHRHDLSSIAFPAISTGVYGYPPEEAAAVVSLALTECLTPESSVKEVRLVFFDQGLLDIFVKHQQFAA